MMKKIVIPLCMVIILGGCAYRHYVGLHGPTIWTYPDIHDGAAKDTDCLGCHDPDQNPTGPATSHPRFKGCLKCHNDTMK